MVINVIKLVVGVDSVADLHTRNLPYIEEFGGRPAVPVYTRFRPKREKDILPVNGRNGSLYRVIKNRIQCRQEIIGFDSYEDDDGITRCRIMVDPQMVLTVAQPFRPFQGWRYLDPAKAPADKGVFDPDKSAEDDMPEEMQDELSALGLL